MLGTLLQMKYVECIAIILKQQFSWWASYFISC